MELMQREAKSLEQALRQSGMPFEQGNLTFSLSGRNADGETGKRHYGKRKAFQAAIETIEAPIAAAQAHPGRLSGLDLRV
jgi:hypothetical protein